VWVGLLTAWVALGVAQLIAGIGRPQGSPVAAVGGLAIDNTPPPVKNFAIATFGSNDKKALVLGMLVVLAVLAAIIGIAAMRRLSYGYLGLGIFAVIGLAGALTRPNAEPVDVLPTLLGALAGAFALSRLVRVAKRRAAPGGAAARVPASAEPADALPAAWLPADEDEDEAAETADTAEPAETAEPAKAPGPARASDATEAAEPGADAEPAGDTEPDEGDAPDEGAEPEERDPLDWVPATRSPAEPSPAAAGTPRRSFLTVSAVALAAGGIGALAGRSLSERSSVSVARSEIHFPRPAHPAPPLPPGTHPNVTGLEPFITPNGAFYRVDTALILPQVAPQTWHLRIHGMVDREITLSFDELLRRPLIEDYITLCCVSNPVGGPYIGNAKWLGASLASLLRTAGVKAGADQLLCTSVDGFTSGTPIATVMDGRDALVAVAMNGTPLPVAHGFPARLVVPGLYGYVSACKWVTDIKVTTFAAEHAYWTVRGWSQRAPIKTESRIDVPNSGVKPGRTAVAGVAWAQHKGIDAVHVRVDKGPWQQATLAAVPGIDTWRQWVWEWDATPGTHVIESRATDRTGYTQTSLQEPPEPNGASGYPSIAVQVS
jgi:DMSO/TMAO reductase YedYZ molybdopterin-dependent catalytic subunit